MTKYILKRDLPLAKAGTEVFFEDDLEWTDDLCTIINSDWLYLCDICKKDIQEWLKEVKEKKTIYDLEVDDEYWYLNNDLNVRKEIYYWWWFAEGCHYDFFLTEREAKRNKLLRQLATRTDKWLPEKWEKCIWWDWETCTWDWMEWEIAAYHFWFVFRDKEEYEKYINEEARDLLFNL